MQIGKLNIGFAKTPEQPQQNETGWSETSLYSGQFGKYNPDSLIGRKGFSIYRQMMLDEQVKAVVRFKRDAITSREWYFESPEELSEKERGLRVALSKKLIAEMSGNFMDAMNGIMSGMYNGFSMTELVVRQIEFRSLTYWGVGKLKLRPFDTFSFKVDAHGNAEEVIQRFETQTQTIDMERFIHYVQNPEEDEHYGQSELRAAYRAYWSKDVMIKLYNIFMERRASGFIYAQPKDGKTIQAGSPLETALRSVMTNISTTTSMIVPNDVDLNVVHPQGEAGYVEAVAMHDKAIAKALLVPNLLGITEQGDTGSFAQSQTQFEAFLMTLDADATRLEDVLNEQLFRRLAKYNWGDDNYPRFKFKPMSDEQKFKLLGMWKDLVTSGAVKHSSSDEEKLRNMMDMPQKEDDGKSPLVAEQVRVLTGLIKDYKSRKLDKETAVSIITVSFPIDEDRAEEMLGEQDPESEHQPPAIDGSPVPSQVAPEWVVVPPSDEDAGAGLPLNDEKAAKLTAATNRVDFAVIEKESTDIEGDYVKDIQIATNSIVAYVLKNTTINPEEVSQIEVPMALREPLRRAFGRMLKAGWELGTKHAKAETAKTSTFAEGVPDPLGTAAAAYFKAKSFTMSGGLSDRILGKAQTTMFNGIKSGADLATISNNIESVLEAEGVYKATHQIDTMVRTGVFEAVNESRFDYFRSPELGSFVEALEYSAIMDDRTTAICNHMDERTYAKDDDVWSMYRPPNHYNCRSLLIAVTVDDAWAPSEKPTIQPQEGFK